MTADISHRRSPLPACDALFHPALTGHFHGERAARHVLVGELDVDDVVARLRGAVGDPARAILQVLCVDVHLAGTLDGQAEPTVACITGVNDKLCRLKGVAFVEAPARDPHAAGIPDLRLADHHWDGAARHMLAILLHMHQVLACLLGHERDPHVAIAQPLQQAGLLPA